MKTTGEFVKDTIKSVMPLVLTPLALTLGHKVFTPMSVDELLAREPKREHYDSRELYTGLLTLKNIGEVNIWDSGVQFRSTMGGTTGNAYDFVDSIGQPHRSIHAVPILNSEVDSLRRVIQDASEELSYRLNHASWQERFDKKLARE